MDVEKRKIKLCGPKTVLLNARFDNTQSVYAGKCVLGYRIDNVLAMRIKYFNISLLAADLSAQTSCLLLLRSSTLGGSLSYDLFRTATTTLLAQQTAQTESSVIGWAVRHANDSFFSGTAIQQSSSNNLLRFVTAIPIESFDWSIESLNATLPAPLGHNYNIEIAIEFFQECQCESELVNVYSL